MIVFSEELGKTSARQRYTFDSWCECGEFFSTLAPRKVLCDKCKKEKEKQRHKARYQRDKASGKIICKSRKKLFQGTETGAVWNHKDADPDPLRVPYGNNLALCDKEPLDMRLAAINHKCAIILDHFGISAKGIRSAVVELKCAAGINNTTPRITKIVGAL